MAKKVLIFGFEPFLSYNYNASGEIAGKLNGKTVGDAKVIGKVLPVAHKASAEIAKKIIEDERPDAVIVLAQAAQKGCITLERVALNWYYFNKEGEIDEPLHRGEQQAYFSTLPLPEIKSDLEGANIPAEYSFTADTYVSNEVFYETMRSAQMHKVKHAGLIHLPLVPQQVIAKKELHYATRIGIPSMNMLTMETAIRVVINALTSGRK